MKNLQKIQSNKEIMLGITSSLTVDRSYLSHPVSNSTGGDA